MEEMTVTQVAEILGKTDRTIRNYIKDGRIKARRVENQFGWEYRVYDLGGLDQAPSCPEQKSEIPQTATTENGPRNTNEARSETALQITTEENKHLWEEIRQLREINSRLAYDLGTRDQRIKELEQVLEKSRNLLPEAAGKGGTVESENKAAPPKPWWKRIFHIKS